MELEEGEADLAVHVLDDRDAAAKGVDGRLGAGAEGEEAAVGLALTGALEECAPPEDVGAVIVEHTDGAAERLGGIEGEGAGKLVVDHVDLVRPLGGDECLGAVAVLECVGEEDGV